MNVLTSRSVTLLTGDADHKAHPAVAIQGWCEGIEISSVAFKTTRNHWSIEIHNAIAVSRAVHPANFLPVGHGQLKKQITFPEQKSLSLTSRTDYQAEALGAGSYVGWHSLHGRLEKTITFCLHSEKQIGIRSLEKIVVRSEIAKNGISVRKPGRQIVGGSMKAFDRVLMTATTRIVTDILVLGIRLWGRVRSWARLGTTCLLYTSRCV